MLNDPCGHPLRWMTSLVQTIFTPMRSGNYNSKPIQRTAISLHMPHKGNMSGDVPAETIYRLRRIPWPKIEPWQPLLHALGGSSLNTSELHSRVAARFLTNEQVVCALYDEARLHTPGLAASFTLSRLPTFLPFVTFSGPLYPGDSYYMTGADVR